MLCSPNNYKLGRMIRSLQILRFLAAAGVVYYHTHAAPVFGGAGVDIFFVLSGFIIAMLMAKGSNAVDFAKGRITRVVPLYWTITLVLFVVVLLWPWLFHTTAANPMHLVRSLLFIEHIPLLQVGWTLNYEMFFYALATVCLWLRWRIPVLILGLFATFVVGQIFGGVLSDSRVLEFVLGILVFEATRRKWTLPAWLALLGALVGFAFIIGAEIRDPSAAPFLRFGLPAALIVWSAISLERFVVGWLATALVLLGDASYALYLTHSFVVEAFRRVAPAFLATTPGALTAVAAASMIGLMTYWLVDKPGMRLSRRLMGRAHAS